MLGADLEWASEATMTCRLGSFSYLCAWSFALNLTFNNPHSSESARVADRRQVPSHSASYSLFLSSFYSLWFPLSTVFGRSSVLWCQLHCWICCCTLLFSTFLTVTLLYLRREQMVRYIHKRTHAHINDKCKISSWIGRGNGCVRRSLSEEQ